MKIHILGAHNIESNKFSCPSFVIDDIIAIEAASLTSRLTLAQQKNLKALLLTHHHFDHTRDIPLLGMSLFLQMQSTLDIYAPKPVIDSLKAHLLGGDLYPDFTAFPADKATFSFTIIEPGKAATIAGYNILPLSVNHSVPTIGYQITSFDEKSVFISSDTGPGLEEIWKQISPQLLLIETTGLNKDDKFAHDAGHLTPSLLHKELESFRDIKGYIPQVVLTHVNPLNEKQLKAEIRQVEKALKIKIRFGREGMTLKL
jgi:ribonuclease BN (tRNA processing enzyme)